MLTFIRSSHRLPAGLSGEGDGRLEFNRNSKHCFAEVEQSAFSPSNIVPGIGFLPGKMLHARIFSYADAHRYRVGTHHGMLPVNRPKSPVPLPVKIAHSYEDF